LAPSSPGFRRDPERGSRRRKRPHPDLGEGPEAVRREALGAILDELVRQRPWSAGMAVGELARRWAEVVGDRLAEESSPAALEGGVLFVRASTSAWGAQLRFLAKEVGRRANDLLEGSAVREVKVVLERPD
jgi:predicted nucleic acid-binding Zn ribbon protein